MLVNVTEPFNVYRNKSGVVVAAASDVAWTSIASGALAKPAADIVVRVIEGGPVQIKLNATTNDAITVVTEFPLNGMLRSVSQIYFSSTPGATVEVFEVPGAA